VKTWGIVIECAGRVCRRSRRTVQALPPFCFPRSQFLDVAPSCGNTPIRTSPRGLLRSPRPTGSSPSALPPLFLAPLIFRCRRAGQRSVFFASVSSGRACRWWEFQRWRFFLPLFFPLLNGLPPVGARWPICLNLGPSWSMREFPERFPFVGPRPLFFRLFRSLGAKFKFRPACDAVTFPSETPVFLRRIPCSASSAFLGFSSPPHHPLSWFVLPRFFCSAYIQLVFRFFARGPLVERVLFFSSSARVSLLYRFYGASSFLAESFFHVPPCLLRNV